MYDHTGASYCIGNLDVTSNILGHGERDGRSRHLEAIRGYSCRVACAGPLHYVFLLQYSISGNHNWADCCTPSVQCVAIQLTSFGTHIVLCGLKQKY